MLSRNQYCVSTILKLKIHIKAKKKTELECTQGKLSIKKSIEHCGGIRRVNSGTGFSKS